MRGLGDSAVEPGAPPLVPPVAAPVDSGPPPANTPRGPPISPVQATPTSVADTQKPVARRRPLVLESILAPRAQESAVAAFSSIHRGPRGSGSIVGISGKDPSERSHFL